MQCVCQGDVFFNTCPCPNHALAQLFLVLLPRLPADAVPAIFSRNFCRTVSDNVGKPDTYLHAMAKRVMVGPG